MSYTSNWQIVTGHWYHAFTLIEMIIVIVIAAILMLVVMGFGGRFVRDIEARQLREQWISEVAAVRGRLLLSRYSNGHSISGLVLRFDNDNTMTQEITYTDNTTLTNITHTYTGMILSWSSLSLVPYQLSCAANDITHEIITLTFDNSDKTYCYKLHDATCTLHRTPCDH